MTVATPTEASLASDNARVIAPPPLIYPRGLDVGFGLQVALPSESMRSGLG